MCAMRTFFLRSCLLFVVVTLSAAGVTLEIVGDKTSFQEGSEVQLLCKISPYHNEMTWVVNNDPYALCIANTCNGYSNKPFVFVFNFNESIGEFRLTIDAVNSSHANLEFVCDDGSEIKSVSFNVTTVKVSGGNGGFNYLWLLLLLLLLIPCGIGICCCCCKGKQNASNTKRGFQMTTSLQTEIPKFAPVNPFATHCNIEWTGSASEYMLEYRLENEKDWNKQGIILKERKTCLRNLQPDKSYKIRIYAINQSNMVLEPPGESQFKTKGKEDTTNSSSKEENKETASPLPNLNVTKKSANTEPSSTCYDIKWDVENVDETRRVVLRYMLEYSLGDEDNWTKEKHILLDNNFKFENLSPETSYKIRVYPIYQSKVLTPGEYQFRTQPRKNPS